MYIYIYLHELYTLFYNTTSTPRILDGETILDFFLKYSIKSCEESSVASKSLSCATYYPEFLGYIMPTILLTFKYILHSTVITYFVINI